MNIYELAKRLNVITIHDVERYTIIELIYMICEKLNTTTVTLKDLIEVGLSQAVAEQLVKWMEDGTLEQELSDLVLKIPYHDYDRNETGVGYGEFDKTYEGFSQFTKRTYGRYEQGTVVSVVANADNPMPQLTGTDTKGLATYTNRDSCSLYVENNGQQPPLTIPANQVIYHANDCVLPSDINMSQFKVGMILDTDGSVNKNWYVGIVKSIKGTTLVLEDGWYLVRNDGVTPTKGVPSNGLGLRVNMNNKIWNINSNMFIHEGCPAGANMELGVLCNHTDINDVGGIDLINMRKTTHYGIKVRGNSNGFLEGYISDNNHAHFVAKSTAAGLASPLLVSYNTTNNTEQFSISGDGMIKGGRVAHMVASKSTSIPYGISVVLVNGNDVDITLPSPEAGRIIKILTLGANTLVTATPGSGVVTPDLQQQQISIAKGSKSFRVVELFSDGGVWYVLNDYM